MSEHKEQPNHDRQADGDDELSDLEVNEARADEVRGGVSDMTVTKPMDSASHKLMP